jgi:hypothetical protein
MILRKFQKVIWLTQKWKDFKNNGATWKLVSILFKWVPMLWGFNRVVKLPIFLHSDFGRPYNVPCRHVHYCWLFHRGKIYSSGFSVTPGMCLAALKIFFEIQIQFSSVYQIIVQIASCTLQEYSHAFWWSKTHNSSLMLTLFYFGFISFAVYVPC